MHDLDLGAKGKRGKKGERGEKGKKVEKGKRGKKRGKGCTGQSSELQQGLWGSSSPALLQLPGEG